MTSVSYNFSYRPSEIEGKIDPSKEQRQGGRFSFVVRLARTDGKSEHQRGHVNQQFEAVCNG